MSDIAFNKFRAAVEVLQRSRDVLVENLAEDVLSQADEWAENGFLFNEFLENQGTRLHFLCLIQSQLEQSAEAFDEAVASSAPPPPLPPAAPKKRRSRSKKLSQQASTDGLPEDL